MCQYNFYSMLQRQHNIQRWALMHNTYNESVAAHSRDVAVIAHALAEIGNRYCGKKYNAERVALLALYHDVPEIITGDMPTPVKHLPGMRVVFQEVEDNASELLLGMLPKDMGVSHEFRSLFFKEDEDAALWYLIKAADKISALIKCQKEEFLGNREFLQAKAAQLESLKGMYCQEAGLFLLWFMDGFTMSLDETVGGESNA